MPTDTARLRRLGHQHHLAEAIEAADEMEALRQALHDMLATNARSRANSLQAEAWDRGQAVLDGKLHAREDT